MEYTFYLFRNDISNQINEEKANQRFFFCLWLSRAARMFTGRQTETFAATREITGGRAADFARARDRENQWPFVCVSARAQVTKE